MNSKRSKLGFTVLEMMIAVAILVIAAAVAIPNFEARKRQDKIQRQARLLVAHFAKVRSLAASGQTNLSWGPADRTVNAGIRVVSPTAYELFIDRNSRTDNDEIVVERVDFTQEIPGIPVQFASASVPYEVRYNASGTLETPSSSTIDLTLEDLDTQRTRVIRVTYGGLAKIHL